MDVVMPVSFQRRPVVEAGRRSRPRFAMLRGPVIEKAVADSHTVLKCRD
jgi:hypothetical protein